MTLPIPDKTMNQIRGLLEYRNLIEAIRVYRKATGCGLKDAKDAVDQLRDQFRQEDPERFGGIAATAPSPGSAWTLIGGLIVFVAILTTVYAYVFPRLSGEQVSATASLEVRAAYPEASEHAAEMKLPDGRKCYVAKHVLLAASDFGTFRGLPDDNGVPQLMLNLSSAGQAKMKLLKGTLDSISLAVVIHDRLIACSNLDEWSPHGVTISLNGLSSSDANEVFARLTE